MLQNFSISQASPDDCKSVAAMEAQCFSHPWSESGVRSALEREDTVFLKAAAGQTLLGYISFQFVLDEGYINNVAVAASFRRRGIGKCLIQAALQEAKRRNLSFLTLEVRASNEAAVNLYRSLRFEPVGRRKNFYSDPAEDALLMTRVL